MSDQRSSSESGCGLAVAIAAVGLIAVLLLAVLGGSYIYVRQSRMQDLGQARRAELQARDMVERAQVRARELEQQADLARRVAELREAAYDAANIADASGSSASPSEDNGWQAGQSVELRRGDHVRRAEIVERRADGQLLLRLKPDKAADEASGKISDEVSDNDSNEASDGASGGGSSGGGSSGGGSSGGGSSGAEPEVTEPARP